MNKSSLVTAQLNVLAFLNKKLTFWEWFQKENEVKSNDFEEKLKLTEKMFVNLLLDVVFDLS